MHHAGNKIWIVLVAILLVSTLSGENKTVAQLDDWYKRPAIFHMDNLHLYVVGKNRKQIVIYSRKDYQPILQFGRSGEGPGEFRSIQSIQVINKEIVISNLDRISVFSLRGKFLKDIRKPKGYTYRTVRIQNKYISIRPSRNLISYVLWDEKFKKEKEMYFCERKNFPRDRATGKRIANLLPLLDYYRTGKNHIVIGDTKKGFFLKVFNANGRLLNEIKRDITPRPVNNGDRKRIMSELIRDATKSKIWGRLKATFNYTFPDYYPAYADFFIRDEILYVFGFEQADGKQPVTVLDLKGKVLKEFVIPYIGEEHFRFHDYQIYQGKLYYIYDNEETECWELRAVELN